MKPALASGWTRQEERLLERLSDPYRIQAFLDRIPYDDKPGIRSPRWVIRERKAHCFEGALFAAAALRRLGHRPLVVDMYAVNDDDHDIAVFRSNGYWGAVAKSNFVTLRFREPVYRTLRELVMSYFDFYFNTLGDKSLRSYARPLDLGRFDRRGWMTTDEDIGYIGDELNRMKHRPILAPGQVRALNRVDKLLFRAGLLGAKPSGLYRAKPRNNSRRA
ncbi:MAG: hypothetical protein MUQ00_09270 [Candidatus Aminicenantes bacterium]|jgi:hypothetical protein|nr:hypothetical protein [Candidatus Aminicenantes bacterium]